MELRQIGQADFTKFNGATGEFVGVMTSETPDDSREIMDFAKSKPYFEAWSEGIHKASGGKSYGNVREMHGLSAAGKLTRPLLFDSATKEITVHGVIVDPIAKRKAEEGVYVGLSIGGRYVDRFPDTKQPGLVRYIADPVEVSLVDRPNNPNAVLELLNAAGASRTLPLGFSTLPLLDDGDRRLLKAAGLVVADRVLDLHVRTKRVGGRDLTPEDFAYVGDPANPSTWKYAVGDGRQARNALARWGTEKIPAAEKEAVYGRIKAAAARHGVAVSADADVIIKALYDLGGMAGALARLDAFGQTISGPLVKRVQQAMADLGVMLTDVELAPSGG